MTIIKEITNLRYLRLPPRSHTKSVRYSRLQVVPQSFLRLQLVLDHVNTLMVELEEIALLAKLFQRCKKSPKTEKGLIVLYLLLRHQKTVSTVMIILAPNDHSSNCAFQRGI